MNIAIAGRSMNTSGGVKEYLEGLCYGLSQLEKNSARQILFFKTPGGKKPTHAGAIKITSQAPENRLLWDHLTLPRLAKQHSADVILHVKNTIPLTVKTPSVVVVHDLIHHLHPEVFKQTDARYMQWMMKRTLPKAQHIIAISQSTKKDLLRLIPGINPEKVSVVYQAARPMFDATYTDEAVTELRQRLNLPDKFFLYTGSLSPRKNVTRLLTAFASIADKTEADIVVTGGKSWGSENIGSHVESLGVTSRVHRLGFVEDADMPLLYRAATVYVYPSLYEGFGIPLLEAMASETPVISANTSSMPEVGGDAVLYIDPTNTDQLADALFTLIDSPQLQEKYIRRGREQRKKFSWTESAKAHISILEQAAA